MIPFVIDNVNVPQRKLAAFKKRSSKGRSPDTVTVAVLHQTDCVFGTAEYQRRPWIKVAKELDIPAGDATRDFTHRMAKRARLWNVPYHYVITQDGEVLWNQPLAWRTYHADAGNGGIGIAFEGRWPGLERDREDRHSRLPPYPMHALMACLLHARGQGAPVDQLQAHRNYAPPSSRASDPGEGIWRAAVVPLTHQWAARPDLVWCDYEGAANGGRPIPIEWDPDALFDWHGKRVKGGAA